MQSEQQRHDRTGAASSLEARFPDLMSRRALLCVCKIPEGTQKQLESGMDIDPREGLDAATTEALGQIKSAVPHRPELLRASFGLDTSWLGVAIEVIEAIGAAGTGGAHASRVARRVKELYSKVTAALGRKPLISRGTAEWLAIADLADREPSSGCWRYASGDINRMSPSPAAKQDMFFVVLSTRRELHHYHISVYGDLFSPDTSPRVERELDAPPPYWAGGS